MKSIFNFLPFILMFSFFSSVSQAVDLYKDPLILFKDNTNQWSVVNAQTGQVTEKAFKPGNAEGIFKPPYFFHADSIFSSLGYFYHLPFPNNPKVGNVPTGMSSDLSMHRFVYVDYTDSTTSNYVAVSDIDGTSMKKITDGGAEPKWISNDLIMLRGGDLLGGNKIFTVKPDGVGLKEIYNSAPNGLSYLSLSKKRDEVVFTERTGGNNGADTLINSVNVQTGAKTLWVSSPDFFYALTPRFSPDGSKVAFMARSELIIPGKMSPYNLWVVDRPGDKPRALLKIDNLDRPGFIFGKGYTAVASFDWSSDGSKLAFLAAMDGDCRMMNEGGGIDCHYDVYVVDADGTNFKRLTRLKLKKGGGIHWVNF